MKVNMICGDYLFTLENGFYTVFEGVTTRETPMKLDDGIEPSDISYILDTGKLSYTMTCAPGVMIATLITSFVLDYGTRQTCFCKIIGDVNHKGESDHLLIGLVEQALLYMRKAMEYMRNENN